MTARVKSVLVAVRPAKPFSVSARMHGRIFRRIARDLTYAHQPHPADRAYAMEVLNRMLAVYAAQTVSYAYRHRLPAKWDGDIVAEDPLLVATRNESGRTRGQCRKAYRIPLN